MAGYYGDCEQNRTSGLFGRLSCLLILYVYVSLNLAKADVPHVPQKLILFHHAHTTTSEEQVRVVVRPTPAKMIGYSLLF